MVVVVDRKLTMDRGIRRGAMPDYAKLHDLISHRVTVEYDTGARITGYLASCQPASGPVEFVVLSEAKLIDSSGRVLRETKELTMCPNVLTSFSIADGPRGRDIRAAR